MDVLAILEENLTAVTGQRDQTRAMIAKAQEELKVLFAKSPKKPKGSLADIDKTLKDLETQRTRTSLSLTEEKQLMKKIFAGEREKRQLQERIDHDKKIDAIKEQVQEMRQTLQPLTDKISDLEKAISKAKLAKKLGCEISDLEKAEVACPGDKLGKVIGKNGAMLKKIEKKASVSLDVDASRNMITIHGSAESFAIAKEELDKIITATEEELELPKEQSLYLSTNTTGALERLRESHPDMYLDVARNGHKMTMRGQADQLASLKVDLKNMGVVKAERQLTSAEATLVIGKKGANIEKITKHHNVAIEVQKKSDDESLATVAGPQANVDAAMKEMEDLISANAEVTKMVFCSKTVVQAFLTANGIKIKELQKQISASTQEEGAGSVLLSFDKATGDGSNLLIKGRSAAMSRAVAMVGEAIRDIDTSTIRIMADQSAIGQVLGKHGNTIQKLKGDKKVNIEVDKKTGEIAINGLVPEEVAEVEANVLEIIAENKVQKIPVDPALLEIQYRELVRSKVRNEVTDLAKLDIDKAQSAIILRGTDEKVHQAAEIVKTFLASNYVEKIEITDADKDVLLSGGQKSKIVNFAKELEVNLSVDRATSSIQVKGTIEKVKVAVKTIKAYLFGGEGNTTLKISVAEEALGLVIGKGGKVRKSLEAKYDCVSLYIHRTNDAITLRGPEEQTLNCRNEILKLIASGRVTQEISATEEQVEKMNKNNLMRRITQHIPVQCTTENTTIKVRGVAPDVKDAVALLKEHMTGVYESTLELGDSQFAKIQHACHDESHFARIKTSADAGVALQQSNNAIVVSGKKNNVKVAKFQLLDLVEFICPGEFARVKLPKAMHATVGQATGLIEVAAATGTMISLDRDVSMILIQSTESDRVAAAVATIQAKITEAEKLTFLFEFDTSEAWLIPAIIGKNGSHVNSIRKESGCTIEVSKEERTVLVTASDEEAVAKAKASIQQYVDKSKKENAFLDIPIDAIARFVGKGGAHISELRKQYEVEIEANKKGSVKITGSEDKVLVARNAVEAWLKEWAKPEEKKEIQIQRHHIAPILGKQGATIQALQEEFQGCRIDMNREALTVTVRGDPEKQALALKRIGEIMAANPAPERPARAPVEDETGEHAGADETPTKAPKTPTNGAESKDKGAKKPENIDPDELVDRTKEFPSLPIGITPTKKRRKRKSKAAAVASPASVIPHSKSMTSSSGEESSVSDEDDKIVARDPAGDNLFVNVSA